MKFYIHFLLGCSFYLAADCSIVKLTDIAGSFESPKDSTGITYADNIHKSWIIESTLPGRAISLYFSAFELEDSYESDKGSCVYDYLEISGDENVTKRRFCGSSSQANYEAPQLRKSFIVDGKMNITFVSDYSNEGPFSGFSAHYTIQDRDECKELEVKKSSMADGWDELLYCNHQCINIPGTYSCACNIGYKLHENKHTCIDDCGTTLYTADQGSIMPKLYKNKYSKLSDCIWKIKAKPGISVHLRFLGKFNIEEHFEEGCVYDWVQFEDHTGNFGDKYCGKSLPNKGEWIDTNSYEISVHFVTDLSVEMEGFQLQYKFDRVKCKEVLRAPDNGEVSTASTVFEGKASYICNIGYRLIGNKERVCEANGQWSGKQPVCQIKKCEYPNHLKNLKNGRISTKDVNLEYGSQVQTACYIWYEISSGSQTWTCGDDLQWHPDIDLPGQDNIPECKLLCGLKGNKAVMNGTYDFGTAIPKDDDTESGFGVKIIGGKPARRGEWPWMAVLNIVGRGGMGWDNYICGGTLVSENVVVSAAHCWDRWLPDSTLVYIGAHNRKNKTDEAVQVFKVKTLHLHPDYDVDTKANDIAVVILNTTVQIGLYARPICIPTREKEKELPMRGAARKEGYLRSGVVAGWGRISSVPGTSPSPILYMVRLEAIAQDKCYRDFENTKPQVYRENNITLRDNMFCGGNLFSPQDSCDGDSGGPYMYKDLETSRWFLNGVVSLGSTLQCGLDTFGIYTNVAHHLNWLANYVTFT